MEGSDLSHLNWVTALKEMLARGSQSCRRAAIPFYRPNYRPNDPMFRKLPTEIILLIMCHSRCCDLTRLIQTKRSMNEIFKNHKTSIFKRMQKYQYPDFLKWFGDLPGFDGTSSGDSRTFEQIQCLNEVVFSLNRWSVVHIPGRAEAVRVSLRLLDRYGGWRYLCFLNFLDSRLEEEARSLYRVSHKQIPAMTEGLAKRMALCLFRMSCNAATIEGSGMEDAADMRARVESRLNHFDRSRELIKS